jgi:hypothetical protein
VNFKDPTSTICKKEVKEVKEKKAIYKVVPDSRTDIYGLYTINTNIFHSYAFIPNYTTSTMMNKIFHNLKDHETLDYLEDSDDEDYITDQLQLDDKWKNMECIYNYKFKKWIPIKVIE